MTTSRQIGVVGVGLMGHGIASSLLRAGYQVCFLEHPGNQPVDDLVRWRQCAEFWSGGGTERRGGDSVRYWLASNRSRVV